MNPKTFCDMPPSELTFAVEALGDMVEHSEVAQVIVRYLQHPNALVREGAVYAAESLLDQPEILQALKRCAYEDFDETIRKIALRAISESKNIDRHGETMEENVKPKKQKQEKVAQEDTLKKYVDVLKEEELLSLFSRYHRWLNMDSAAIIQRWVDFKKILNEDNVDQYIMEYRIKVAIIENRTALNYSKNDIAKMLEQRLERLKE